MQEKLKDNEERRIITLKWKRDEVPVGVAGGVAGDFWVFFAKMAQNDVYFAKVAPKGLGGYIYNQTLA